MEDLVNRLKLEIISEYERDAGVYKDFAEINLKLFDAFVKENAINVYSIAANVMSRDTLIKRLSGNLEKISSLSDVDDLVSIKILTFFDDEANNISEIINTEFRVVMDYSVRPETMNPNRFGYHSRHYVTRMLDKRLEWIEYRRFTNFKLRIEVRSLLQHAWSEFQTQLFGGEGNLAQPALLRASARVVGILELADRELKKIKQLSQRNKLEHRGGERTENAEVTKTPPGKPKGKNLEVAKEEQSLKIESTPGEIREVLPATPREKEKDSHLDVGVDFDHMSEFILNDLTVRKFDREIADAYEVRLEYREPFIGDLSKLSGKFRHLSLADITHLMQKHKNELKNVARELLPEDGKVSYVARGLSLLVIFHMISSLNGEKELMADTARIAKLYGD